MADQSDTTLKVIALYRKLSNALDVVDAVSTDDAPPSGVADLVHRIRELSVELEQFIDDETESGNENLQIAGRIRTVEREISVLMAQVQGFGRQRSARESGWSY